MSERNAEIIRLHTVAKLSFGQIAQRLGITRNNARGSEKYHFNDLTGRRFGRLKALLPTKARYGNNIVWKCQCDCGALCSVASAQLTSGNNRSCGCLAKNSGRYKPQVDSLAAEREERRKAAA